MVNLNAKILDLAENAHLMVVYVALLRGRLLPLLQNGFLIQRVGDTCLTLKSYAWIKRPTWLSTLMGLHSIASFIA